MSILPESLVAISAQGQPLAQADFRRVDPRSDIGRRFSEANWDDIICANVGAMADALRAANMIAIDSTLRVLGRQVDAVDVLLAEVRADGDEDATFAAGEPRRLILLEDKLVTNPQAKREVLAQLLDYSQKVQTQWTVENLCPRVRPEVAQWLRLHGARIDVMLAQGDMLLVIAGDDIDEDLLRLARRFAAGGDPLSRSELCLVAMPIYRRGNESLFLPHVVSAVERHQRQLSIRVTVQSQEGRTLPAKIEHDPEADAVAARRGTLPTNPDVEAFLARARERLDPLLLVDGSPYTVTDRARKTLAYWLDDEARIKIHFGGFVRDAWSPIQVGLLVESKEQRDAWGARIKEAYAKGLLPAGTEIREAGRATVEALKSIPWSLLPADLSDELLEEVVSTALAFEAAFGRQR